MTDLPTSRHLCLVLEDNWLIAEGLSAQLAKAGFARVECCASCDDALRFLGENEAGLPDLALLDVSIGAHETCLPVAQELVRLNVPYIIVSGYAAGSDVRRLKPEYPALQKPVFESALVEALDQVLPGRGAHSG
jgi:CheY-like chemotaxis protein